MSFSSIIAPFNQGYRIQDARRKIPIDTLKKWDANVSDSFGECENYMTQQREINEFVSSDFLCEAFGYYTILLGL